MKFVIPANNVKTFARSVFALSKMGDEIYIEPLDDSVIKKKKKLKKQLKDAHFLIILVSKNSLLFEPLIRLGRRSRVSRLNVRFSRSSNRARRPRYATTTTTTPIKRLIRLRRRFMRAQINDVNLVVVVVIRVC